MERQSIKQGENRTEPGGNGLPVFPQNDLVGRPALHQLVIECVHGAKLRNWVAAH